MSDRFPGEAGAMPGTPSSRALGSGSSSRGGKPAPRAPVRRARGSEPLVAFMEAAGVDPAVLAADLGALVDFIRAHAAALTAPALVDAGAVFLGDALITAYPRARWRAGSDPEVGSRAWSMPVRAAFTSIRDEAGFGTRMAAGLPERWAAEDARWDEVDAAMASAKGASEAARLREPPGYERPFVQVGPFFDGDGAVIPYGSRWERPGGPPEDAYSRVTHPERFAPLIEVADALVAHLAREYDVTVKHEARTTTLRPREGAPIRVEVTGFPALRLHAGLLLRETLPSCGCDACDETAASEIDSLEQTVLGVVAGGLAEHAPERGGTGAYHLRTPDGGGHGSGGSDVPEDALVAPETVIALRGAPWPAWPRRT